MCNILQLFARVKLYASMDNNQSREALRVAIIPASACEAFASRLQNPDAARAANLVSTLPNRDRLPALADALRTESANPISKTPSKPKRQPARIQRLASQRDACESLKRAAREFPISLQVRNLFLTLAAFAQIHSLDMPKPRLRKATTACPFAVHDACLTVAHVPTAENLLTAVSSLQRYDLTILAQHDALPSRLMSPDVHAPEPNPPVIHRAPAGSLDWSTQPIIGTDPATLAEQAQFHRNKRELLATLAEKRAKRIEPKKRKANKPANRVSKAPVKWHARMGREVLTLKK